MCVLLDGKNSASKNMYISRNKNSLKWDTIWHMHLSFTPWVSLEFRAQKENSTKVKRTQWETHSVPLGVPWRILMILKVQKSRGKILEASTNPDPPAGASPGKPVEPPRRKELRDFLSQWEEPPRGENPLKSHPTYWFSIIVQLKVGNPRCLAMLDHVLDLLFYPSNARSLNEFTGHNLVNLVVQPAYRSHPNFPLRFETCNQGKFKQRLIVSKVHCSFS